MKYSVLFILTFTFIVHINGQYEELVDKKEKRKIIKEQRKKEKELQLQNSIERTKSLIDQQSFVLKADYLTDSRGNKVYVDIFSNFILIDSLSGIIQTSNNYGMGYNGVGGITLEGRIIRFESNKRIKKNSTVYNIKSSISTSLGFYDIFFTIHESGRAHASISGISGGNITFTGKIYPVKNSKIYIGRSYP